jgi:hypothetical protein
LKSFCVLGGRCCWCCCCCYLNAFSSRCNAFKEQRKKKEGKEKFRSPITVNNFLFIACNISCFYFYIFLFSPFHITHAYVSLFSMRLLAIFIYLHRNVGETLFVIPYVYVCVCVCVCLLVSMNEKLFLRCDVSMWMIRKWLCYANKIWFHSYPDDLFMYSQHYCLCVNKINKTISYFSKWKTILHTEYSVEEIRKILLVVALL